MNRPLAGALVGAGVIIAVLAAHLQVISPAATLSAVLLVAVTASVTAAVVYRVVATRDAQLTEIRRILARLREDQVRAKKRSEAIVVDDSDE